MLWKKSNKKDEYAFKYTFKLSYTLTGTITYSVTLVKRIILIINLGCQEFDRVHVMPSDGWLYISWLTYRLSSQCKNFCLLRYQNNIMI